MISKEQFAALKQGDVIWWKSGDDYYERTVALGPGNEADPSKRMSRLFITLPIWRNSWTGRGVTTYGYNDIKDRISVTGKSRKTVCSRDELRTLRGIGLDPKRCFEREKADHERMERIYETSCLWGRKRRYRTRCSIGKAKLPEEEGGAE